MKYLLNIPELIIMEVYPYLLLSLLVLCFVSVSVWKLPGLFCAAVEWLCRCGPNRSWLCVAVVPTQLCWYNPRFLFTRIHRLLCDH